MKKNRSIFVRILAVALVLVTLFGLCGSIIPAFATTTTYDVPAPGDTAYISISDRVYRSDTGEKYVMSNGAHDMRDFKFNFEDHPDMRNYNPDTQLYCIQYGAPLPRDGKYTAIAPANFDYWENFYRIQKEGIMLAIAFGYPSSSLEDLQAATEDDAIAATQAIVWEFMTASRLSFTGYPHDRTFYEEYIENTPAYDAYWNILDMAREYYEDPRYTFEDLLSKSDFVIWQCDGYQSLISYNLRSDDPPDKPKWEDEGRIAVVKMDPNLNYLAGAEFDLFNEKGEFVAHLGPTNDNGYAVTPMALPFGTYTAKETVYPDGYTGTYTESWTIVLDATAPEGIATFYAFNVQETGFVGVIKTTQDIRPIEGVQFGVYKDPECTVLLQTMITEENGACLAEVPANQTVYIKEISVPSDIYIMSDTVYPVFVTKDMITVANNESPIINYQKEWRLKVIKKDNVNGTIGAGDATVSGAVYGLYDANDKLLATYTVGQDGSFTTASFPIGTGYYLQELTAPVGYKLDKTRYYLDRYTGPEVQEENVMTHTMEIGEIVLTGTISITKFTENPEDIGNFTVPEAGAKFVIYLKSAGSYDAAVASGDERTYDHGIVDSYGVVNWSNGENLSKQLAYGTYIVHQVSSWDNRVLVEDFEVEVKQENKNYNFNLQNPYEGGQLVIKKVDADTGLLITDGIATFQIKNTTTGQIVGEVSTVNGIATLSEILAPGSYELVETKAPNGYTPCKNTISFVIDNENRGVVVITVENKATAAKISLEKFGLQFVGVQKEESEFGSVSKPVFEKKYLAGAVFNVIAAEDIVGGDGVIVYQKGEIVDVITTSADGVVYSKDLRPGKYQLVEVETPAGYYTNGKPIDIDLSDAANGVVVPVSVENSRMTSEISLVKQAMVWVTKEDGKTLTVEMQTIPAEGFVFGIYANEKFVAMDGTVIEADMLVGIMTTDATGKAVFTENLPFGKYYVKELKANSDYPYMFNGEYDININPVSAVDNVIVVAVNNGQPILNRFNCFDIELKKIDSETGKPLAGALLEIRDGKNNVIRRGYTDENGVYKVTLVPGKYTFVEAEAPNGYVLNENVYEFEVSAEGKVSGTIQMENDPEINYFEVELKKIDAKTGTPLAGALLEICDAEGNAVCRGYTDENGIYKARLEPGKYTFAEIEAPKGYILNENTYSFEVGEKGNVSGTIRMENTPEPTPFEIELKKIDSKTGEPLAGAMLEVRDADGNAVCRGYTDENGVFKATLLPGKYTFVEIEAPNGYILNKNVFSFEVDEEGNVSGTTQMGNIPDVTLFEVELKKVDEKTGAPLAGALFEVRDAEDNAVCSGYTDENGVYKAMLAPGKYTFIEIEAPKGYILNKDVYEFEVDAEGNVSGTVQMANEPEPAPDTGDKIMIFIILATISAVMVALLESHNRTRYFAKR